MAKVIKSIIMLSMLAAPAVQAANFKTGPGSICGSALTLQVEVKERDTNNLWNHLLMVKSLQPTLCGGEDGTSKLAVSGQVHLSWSQVEKPLPREEGQYIRVRVWAECQAGFGIDESIKTHWASYRVWTCNVDKLEVLED